MEYWKKEKIIGLTLEKKNSIFFQFLCQKMVKFLHKKQKKHSFLVLTLLSKRRSALAHVLLFTSMIPYPTLSHQKFINSPTLNFYLNLIQSLFAIILNKLKLEMPIHMVITFLKILPLYRFSPPSINLPYTILDLHWCN